MIKSVKNSIILICLILLIIPCVSAGNNTTDVNPIHIEPINDNIVIAQENGHFNISFSNNYTGYCLEYGEKEASVGDKFYVTNMSYAVDKNGEYIGDCLKTFFIDYRSLAEKDKITTQHYIWAFTDGFHGWRVNQTIVDNIKNNPKHYTDDGYIIVNDTHVLKYSFRIFLSEYAQHQDFFAYYFKLENIICNNQSVMSNVSNNSYFKIDLSVNVHDDVSLRKLIKKNNIEKKIIKNKKLYSTGNPIWLLLFSIFIITNKKNKKE